MATEYQALPCEEYLEHIDEGAPVFDIKTWQ